MNWNLVVVGFVVHLIFFYSIFDIYFTSPLVHGMMPHSNNMTAPAKRLVLFVADGLRADKLFEVDAHGGTHTPYLRHKIEHDGAWGISHTRVPTESRPGHVALIAGFYEDVSAVAKGWKENPVEFDSVFNESRFTWSWGSPDILPMFSKGASGNHVFIHTYPGHSEDFAEGDMTKLDTWVFEKVKTFFKKAASDADLRQKLTQDRLVFFLHLLGLDTSGHVHKPFSHEYVQNLKIVDGGVREIVNLFEDFYSNDGQTAYVFTADHGMTNWGSHGAGHASETLTPLVAWGSGVRSSIKSDNQHPDGYHNDWNLIHVKRSDVNQADISPFMATLIGAAIPLQSVGTVPIDYLDASDEFKARSLLTNAKQILEQFQIKKKLKEDTTLSLLFKPYRSLISSVQEEKIHLIENLLKDEKFEEAIFYSQSLIELGLEGLAYYHNYDRLFLGTSIALGFLGWMAYIGMLILQNHTNIVQHYNHISSVSHGNNKIIRLVFVAIGVLVVLFLYVQSLRWTYYIYLLLPLFLWNQVGQRLHIIRMTCWYIVDYHLLFKAITFGFFGFLGLELIILSFTYRQLLSLGLIGMTLYSRAASSPQTDKTVLGGWIASCCVVAIFPLLPTVGKVSDYNLVYLSGISSVILTLFVLARILHQPKQSQSHYGHHHDLILPFPVKPLAYVQVLLVFLSICNVWYNVSNRHSKTNVSNSTHLFSWGTLISSFILPMTSSSRLLPRLITIALAFLSPFLLLSISHEGFFYISLCSLMFFWLQLESKLSLRKLELLDFAEAIKLGSMPRHLTFSDTRCAYFFIYFLLTAFFGTGNIASINSFDPTSVLCFLSIFNPFIMGALMLWKILIPFLVVTCTFNAIHLSVNVPTQSLFLLVLLMSDFMALHFFFFVRDYGSWLEIGTSISHYVVVMSIILFLFVLLSVSKIFTEVTLRLPHKCSSKCHKQ